MRTLQYYDLSTLDAFNVHYTKDCPIHVYFLHSFWVLPQY